MDQEFSSLLPEPNGQRLDRLRDVLLRLNDQNSNSLSAVIFREALELWADFIRQAGVIQVPAGAIRPPRLADGLDSLLGRAGSDDVDSAIRLFEDVDETDDEAIRLAAHTALSRFIDVINHAYETRQGGDPTLVIATGDKVDAQPHRHVWSTRALMLRETARSIPIALELKKAAVAAVAETAEARDEMAAAREDLKKLTLDLRAARADNAKYTLTTHFNTLMEKERLASNVFRGATAGLVLIAIVVGALTARADDWQGAAAHVSIAALLSGAAAYAARLGGQHRLTADWAASIKVQLQTFRDFLGEIDDEAVRHRVHEEFGKRVLGSPPSSSGDEPAPLPAAQLIELASIIASSRKE